MAWKLKLKFPTFPKLPKPFGWSSAWLWRGTLGVLVLLAMLLVGLLWMSGGSETDEAFRDGRRLLIRLDSNTIEGRQVMLDKIAPASEAAKQEPVVATPADRPAEPMPVASGIRSAFRTMAPINPALGEQTPEGTLPIIAGDGTTPWQYYAKPYERTGSLPMIAVVVGGLGMNKSVTEAALQLPDTITLSFSPYARDVTSWGIAARAVGHEVMLDLPLELSTYPASDPGPYGLLLANDGEENARRLRWLLGRFTGYTGFLMPQNEAFSSSDAAFQALVKSIGARGLLLVIGQEPARGETKQILAGSKTPAVVADLLIDEEPSAAAIKTRLLSLEQTARTRGYAVGIAQPYPLTMQLLAEWAAALEKTGFVLVPVSFAAGLNTSS